MIYRGLGSGIIRVIRADNKIDFYNETSANQFRVVIWRTIQKDDYSIQNSSITIQKNGQNDNITIQNGSNTIQKSVLKDRTNTPEEDSTIRKQLDSSESLVLDYIRTHPTATTNDMVIAIQSLSLGGVKFVIRRLKEKGLLMRVGGRKCGQWKILD